jgi:hypothetical protein
VGKVREKNEFYLERHTGDKSHDKRRNLRNKMRNEYIIE